MLPLLLNTASIFCQAVMFATSIVATGPPLWQLIFLAWHCPHHDACLWDGIQVFDLELVPEGSHLMRGPIPVLSA